MSMSKRFEAAPVGAGTARVGNGAVSAEDVDDEEEDDDAGEAADSARLAASAWPKNASSAAPIELRNTSACASAAVRRASRTD